MTETVVSSAAREVVIGSDQPFIIIGERINPTGRKLLAAEMAAGDDSRVEADVRRVEKVETAVGPRIQEHFVEAMALAHRTNPHPNLARAVKLPEHKSRADAGRAAGSARDGPRPLLPWAHAML